MTDTPDTKALRELAASAVYHERKQLAERIRTVMDKEGETK